VFVKDVELEAMPTSIFLNDNDDDDVLYEQLTRDLFEIS